MLTERDGHWRMTFSFRGRRHFLAFGRVSRAEAERQAGEARALLARIRSGLTELPEGMNVSTFLAWHGVVPEGYRLPGEPI